MAAAWLVLKRLADAAATATRSRRDRRQRVNHDGRSNGMLALNPTPRPRLRKAYHDAGINPRTVDYIEAHGTGTILATRSRPTRWAGWSAAAARAISPHCSVR